MDLRPWQLPAIDWILDHARCALWLAMGMGKTRSVLTALDTLYLTGELSGPTLIVAPKRVCESVWRQEAVKWGFPHLAPVPILGTPKQREASLQKEAQCYVVNFENLPWLVEHLHAWPFNCVVVDESSRLRGLRIRQGGKQAGSLRKVAHQSDRFIELTGTPAPNGLEGLWGQAWFLDSGQRLGSTYTAFLNRWFRQISIGGGQWTRIEPLPHAQKEIQERLSDLCLSIDLADYLSIDEPIVTQVPVTLPAKARELYRRMEKDFFAEIEGKPVEALNAASKSMKLLQLASGSVIHDTKNGEWVHVHDAKLDALESLIEEQGGAPLIVVYHFKATLARLKKRFPQGEEISPEVLERFSKGAVPILWLHAQSAGHGLNLQTANAICFVENTWNLEHKLQAAERCGPTRQLQSGHPRPVFIYDLVANETLDEVVLERHATKREVQDLLLEAVKRRGDPASVLREGLPS